MPFTIKMGNKLLPDIYKLSENDIVYIGVREINQSFESSIVKQIIRYTDPLRICLRSEMTENLCTGKYILEIKLEQRDIENFPLITTILEPTEFFIIGSDKI